MSADEVFGQVEALMRRWELERATALLEEARASGFGPPRMFHDLSVLYAQQGFFREALESIEAALAMDPLHRANWHHSLALQKNNPVQLSSERWRGMHLAYGDTLRQRFDARHLAVERGREPDRALRVGYLCPDTHRATARFVWPVLDLFEAKRVEVFAYWCHEESLDAPGARHPRATHRLIRGIADEDIAAMIVQDRIDILVDVAGHGAGNALPVLALRPAPIQVTWLDYLATTGLETMDYRVTDETADPPGAEAAHVEALARLPVPQWCFRPGATGTPAASAPIAFGSVCVPLKLADPLLDTWARLLQRVPGSRLRFLGIPEGRARRRIVERMAARGVEASRLDLRPRLALADFTAAVANIDVVLDSHPFSGATSTFDALWQGVPVVTRTGALSHSRSGASILRALGRSEWIAASEDEYVATAEALARDRSRLAHEREFLRADLERSVLCDGPRFARAMEDAFRSAWHRWLRETGPGPSSAPRSANERADLLLRSAAQSGESQGLSPITQGLLQVLPSHPTTARLFWKEVAAMAAQPATDRGGPQISLAEIAEIRAWPRAGPALPAGDREWVLLTLQGPYAIESLPQAIGQDLLERHDALAAIGADALHYGDVEGAGRGHVRGVRKLVDERAGKLFLDVWVPGDAMGPCRVLAGPALFARRTWLERFPVPWSASPSESEFRHGVMALSHAMGLQGARLGVCSALALHDRALNIDPAEEWAAAREVERRIGGDRFDRVAVAAGAVKGAFPLAADARFLDAIAALVDGGAGAPQTSGPSEGRRTSGR